MRTRTMTMVLVTVALTGQSVRAHEEDHQTEDQLRREQLRIAVQEICPISGEKLGAMGTPIKVAAGDSKEEVYLCCEGCTNGKIDQKLWGTIHRSIAKAQGKCPISKKDLPRKPKSTVVEGQVIYVARLASIEEVQAEPEAALLQVDEFYASYIKEKKQREKKEEKREHN